MEFSGKNVLITGGGTGTGADMAKAFAARGATVFVSGRRLEPLQSVATSSENIRTIQADVTSETSVQSMFKSAGPCQIVIANAGIAQSTPLSKMTLDEWNSVMEINATGVFLTLREAVKQMETGGRVIVIASILGLTGAAYAAHYTASKHAAVGLVRALAKEVAKKGITVNAICPGYLDTEMTDRTIANIMQKTGMDREKAIANLAGNNPQGRLIRVDEVTNTALYLASDGASSVNGQAISLCGGML